MNESIINRNKIQEGRRINLFPLKGGRMNRFSVVTVMVLCIGLLSSFTMGEQHDYADFPLHKWVMIGFPVTPVDQSPDAVWGPFFGGSQGNDNDAENTLWRFSRWDAEYDTYIRWGEQDLDTNGVYTSIGEPTAIIPGWGYWFYQNRDSGVTFSVSGTEAPDDADYLIPIDPPQNGHRGKTMVGNPFNFPIDWKNTRVIATYSDDELAMDLSLLEANDMGLIDQNAYPWNAGLISGAATKTYIPYNGTNGGTLPKWQGFWVEQLNNYTQYLIIYKVEHTQGDDVCKFHHACGGHPSKKDELGDSETPETDRFVMVVRNPQTNIVVKVFAQGNSSVTFTNWASLAKGTMQSTLGFEITLVDWVAVAVGNDYDYTITFDVRANISEQDFDKPLSQVWFEFGSGSIVRGPGAPNHNNGSMEYPIIPWSPPGNGHAASYTALRTVENAVGAYTNLSLTLKVPPTEVSLQKQTEKYTPLSVVGTVTERDWVMPISISSNDGIYNDSFNAIGILTDASDGYDVFDVAQQTSMGSFIELYFPHNDQSDVYHYWYERPVSVCYDMRSDSSHKGWKIAVAAYGVADQACTIRWDASQVTSDWTLTLYDSEFNVLIEDMKTISEYSLTTQSGSYSAETYYIASNFVPALLSVEPETVPADYTLLRNYPNPFNPTTTIRYYVPQNDWVELAIYNLQGELVKTLWSGDQAAGDYRVKWNGTDKLGQLVASGIYIYKLVSGTKTISNKMLMLK